MFYGSGSGSGRGVEIIRWEQLGTTNNTLPRGSELLEVSVRDVHGNSSSLVRLVNMSREFSDTRENEVSRNELSFSEERRKTSNL